jgi:hypothetical protein
MQMRGSIVAASISFLVVSEGCGSSSGTDGPQPLPAWIEEELKASNQRIEKTIEAATEAKSPDEATAKMGDQYPKDAPPSRESSQPVSTTPSASASGPPSPSTGAPASYSEAVKLAVSEAVGTEGTEEERKKKLRQSLRAAEAEQLRRKANETAKKANESANETDDALKKLAPLILAGGCMALTGNPVACAIAATLVSDFLGLGGQVSPEQAERVYRNSEALANGACDDRCIGELSEDLGLPAELEKLIDKIKDRETREAVKAAIECATEKLGEKTPANVKSRLASCVADAVNLPAACDKNLDEKCAAAIRRCLRLNNEKKVIWKCPG